MNRQLSCAARHRRLLTRALPLAVLGTIAFVAGVVVATGPTPEQRAVSRFLDAWIAQDFAAMRLELSPAAQARYDAKDLKDAYLEAQETATVRTLDPGEPDEPRSDEVAVPIEIRTVAFGRYEGELQFPFEDGGIAWDPSLSFPGLRHGERLDAEIELGERGPILALEGLPLAEGPPEARTSPLGSAAIDVTGTVGVAEPEETESLARQGFPEGTPVGVSGLEQAFNSRLAGKPGGLLVAEPVSGEGSERVLARDEPEPGQPLHTTIDPELQEAAVAGLAGRSGGVAVLDARSGAVRALAGSAFSAPQPPGSTFKIITTVAALETGDVSLEDTFPITNGINVGGRFIYNAHQEYCGGSFSTAFAHSCNAVFAPLGPAVGEEKLVEVSERFGFNQRPALYDREATDIVDPPAPSIPEEVGDDLDLGVSAIGQGQVLATPLVMASASQTIASGGVRRPTPIVTDPGLGPSRGPVRVTSRKAARTLRDLMVGVVTSGTGTAAALIGIQVAGKTGTAELGPDPSAPPPPPGGIPEQIVDAWFTAFAPAEKPRLAVAVMLIDAGADGGTVAAPVAASVLATGLD